MVATTYVIASFACCCFFKFALLHFFALCKEAGSVTRFLSILSFSFYLHSILSCLKELLNYIFLNIFYYYFGPPGIFWKRWPLMCCFLVFEQKKTTKLGTHGHIVLRVPQTTCKSIKFEKCVNSTHPTEQWTVYINNLFCLTIHKCKLLNISLRSHLTESTIHWVDI